MQQSGSRVTVDAASRRSASLIQTLRTPGVVAGMFATTLIGVAVMTPGFVPNRGLDQIEALRWLRIVLAFGVGHVVMVLGLLGLFWAWLRLRPAVRSGLNHSLVLGLWSLPLLLAPPVFSSDAFLYADQGWIISRGLDPYHVGLTQAGGPFAPNVHPVWRDTTAVYPPLALLTHYLVVDLTGYRGLVSVIAMRIPALLAVAVIAAAVPRLARELGADVALARWFAVLNPLLILHFVGGMHNDAWMVALVLVAAWLALRWRIWGMLVGALLVGVGAAFKQPGILAVAAIALLPVAARLPQLRLARRSAVMAGYCLLGGVLAVGAYVAVSLAVGFEFLGWRHAADILESTWGMSPASIAEQLVGPMLGWLGIHRDWLPLLSRITTAASLLVILGLAWRYFFADRILPGRVRWQSVRQFYGGERPEARRSWRDHPLRWLAWSFTAFAFGGAGFHGWYLLWGGLYLGMLRYGNALIRGVVAVMIVVVVVECGLEYFGVRPLTGYLVGAGVGWIFWVNSTRLQILPEAHSKRRDEPLHPTTL